MSIMMSLNKTLKRNGTHGQTAHSVHHAVTGDINMNIVGKRNAKVKLRRYLTN